MLSQGGAGYAMDNNMSEEGPSDITPPPHIKAAKERGVDYVP